MKQNFLILLILFCSFAIAQTSNGVVVDNSGLPISGVNVLEKGTKNGTITDELGKFEIKTKNGAILVFSYIGFKEKENKASLNLKIVLEEDSYQLEGMEVVGTRSTKRSATDTPVAIDIINMADVVTKTGQIDVNQLLQYLAPSFNSSKQSGADGADHIDPATLRGMGPDQTLVLINGKRRHQSSLVNLYGTRGRGNTGTDLNAIPAAAIKRIEVLRDGASAQYGSDAIAGVINIVLKDSPDDLTANVVTGTYNANTPLKDDILSSGYDGLSIQANVNKGFKITDKGFLNATLDVTSKDFTNRPANPNKYDVYRQQFGDSKSISFAAFLNGKYNFSEKTSLYLFGGTSYRDSDAYAWTRTADSPRNITSIYPNGFNPIIGGKILDNSISAGIKTKIGDWDMDINNTFGINKFSYEISNTLNATLLDKSPTTFDAGGHLQYQNTTGVSFTKFYDKVASGFNVALGAEYRIEQFEIFAGEEASYASYDIFGNVVNANTPVVNYVVDINGDLRPGGSQGFPGYSKANEVNKGRSNFSAYIDTELDISENISASAALRYEKYSDFGDNFNFKWAQRFKLDSKNTFRYAVSTGFRAPSLAQKFYNLRFTNFVAGVAEESLLVANDSPIARSFGIDELKQETAFNISTGYTFKNGGFTATIDGYFVKVNDRIVLTGQFDGTSLSPELSSVQFFANAIDTQTHGVDFVFSYDKKFNNHKIGASLVGNINKMKVSDPKGNEILNSASDIETFFGKREKYFLLASAPESKFGLNLDYNFKSKFNAFVRFTRFGKVELIDWTDEVDTYDARIVTDLSLGYQFTNKLGITIGANNLLNIYPSIQNTETETGGNFDSVQMGSNGMFIFSRLTFKL